MLFALHAVGRTEVRQLVPRRAWSPRGVLRLPAVADPRARAGEVLPAFLNNHYVGMAIFIGILLEYVYER